MKYSFEKIVYRFVCVIFYPIFIFYRLSLVVYYDDSMLKRYKTKPRTEEKLREVMLHVEEMYHERDTLTTVVKLGAESKSRMPIIHLSGQDWETNNFG